MNTFAVELKLSHTITSMQFSFKLSNINFMMEGMVGVGCTFACTVSIAYSVGV